MNTLYFLVHATDGLEGGYRRNTQGYQDSDMCQDSDPCAEIELNYLVPNFNGHSCAMTPIGAILNKIKMVIWSVLNAHPCAVTPIYAILNKSQRTY